MDQWFAEMIGAHFILATWLVWKMWSLNAKQEAMQALCCADSVEGFEKVTNSNVMVSNGWNDACDIKTYPRRRKLNNAYSISRSQPTLTILGYFGNDKYECEQQQSQDLVFILLAYTHFQKILIASPQTKWVIYVNTDVELNSDLFLQSTSSRYLRQSILLRKTNERFSGLSPASLICTLRTIRCLIVSFSILLR